MVHRCDTNIDVEVKTVPPSPLGLSITITLKFVHVGKMWLQIIYTIKCTISTILKQIIYTV